jgi:hypothetical protein
MRRIELRPDEQDVLRDVVNQAVAEMEIEVYRTDSHEFRDMLRHRLDLLKHVAIKIDAMDATETVSAS